MVVVTGIVALILIGSAVGTGAIFSGILQANLDSKLRVAVDRLRVADPQLPWALSNAAAVLQTSRQEAGFLLVLFGPGGDVTGAVVDGDVIRQLSDEQVREVVDRADPDGFSTVDITGLSAYRVAPLRANESTVGLAGVSLEELSATVRSVVGTVATVTLVGLVLLGVAVTGVVRIGLRPLRVVADTATKVAAVPMSDGHARISDRVPADVAGQRTEIGEVASALNMLLDHVDVSLEQRQRNEERMRRFVADASHELRTPLASIRGYSELSLRDPALSDMSKQAIDRVHSQSVRMTRLVEDLLLLARLDEGQDLVQGTVDLTQLAVEAVQNIRSVSDDHQWHLDLSDDPITVTGDADRLHQVVSNLLANASAHTPAGTNVTVTVFAGRPDAVVRVHDDGPGIDPSVRDELFERFARGDASRTRATGGTGLGLSISRAIIDAHGGTLTARSAPGDTTFEIRLPMTAADPPAA